MFSAVHSGNLLKLLDNFEIAINLSREFPSFRIQIRVYRCPMKQDCLIAYLRRSDALETSGDRQARIPCQSR